MKPTDTRDPDYFHKVVDCQWACPAHTPVPEYIRLIAQGEFTEAYLVNRRSNVFPGILGRVCDRPCEPACRRGRVEEEPVAICRLKRVAADHRDEVKHLVPQKPANTNGKKIALIGAGPASLTVANDLAPLGYECTIFEAHHRPGGLMISNIPSFRLPEEVLDEEIGYILDQGVELKTGHRIESLKALSESGYDAVFIGSGAPKGKDLRIDGRDEADANIHIGIDWLESVAFEHTDKIGKQVLIIGVGNTAMDCCRTSLRLGADDVKVMARKPRQFFKASPWELEDAEDENVEILVNHSPKRFVVENGKLTGMEFELMEYQLDEDGQITDTRIAGTTIIPCTDVILAIGQENAFPWIERDIGIEFDKWGVPIVDEKTFESTKKGIFFGGDSAFGPKNIIWAVEHGHQAAISIHKHCEATDLKQRLPRGVNLQSAKMGVNEWMYSNSYTGEHRRQMPLAELKARLSNRKMEVETGYTAEQIATEVQRCLNCDVQTVFEAPLCKECDACMDICPVDCLSIVPVAEEAELRQSLRVRANNKDQALFVSEPLKDTGRVMIKDENLCLHCGLCAERCPTAAWDMQDADIFIPHVDDETKKVAAE